MDRKEDGQEGKASEKQAEGVAPRWKTVGKKVVEAMIVVSIVLQLGSVVVLQVQRDPFVWGVADKGELVYEKLEANVWAFGVYRSEEVRLAFRSGSSIHPEGRLTCFLTENLEDIQARYCFLLRELEERKRFGIMEPTRAELEIAKIDFGWVSWLLPDTYVLRSHRIKED